MSVHPNEQLVRDFHDTQRRMYAGECGPEALTRMLADDIVWHVPGRNAIAGDYRGHDEVLGYFAKRRDHADASLRITVHRVLADDEFVLQLAGGSARVGGRTREWETVGVFRVGDGKLAECWLVPFDQNAFDEIWR